jgi:hypothetical protein
MCLEGTQYHRATDGPLRLGVECLCLFEKRHKHSRASLDDFSDRLDAAMWRWLTQAGSQRSLRLCGNALRPVSVSDGSQNGSRAVSEGNEMSPMSLSTRLDKLEAAIRRHDGGPPDEPLIFSLHQWAKAEGCPGAFEPWEADELSTRFMAMALDNLVAAGKIRDCDRRRVRFKRRVLAYPPE